MLRQPPWLQLSILCWARANALHSFAQTACSSEIHHTVLQGGALQNRSVAMLRENADACCTCCSKLKSPTTVEDVTNLWHTLSWHSIESAHLLTAELSLLGLELAVIAAQLCMVSQGIHLGACLHSVIILGTSCWACSTNAPNKHDCTTDTYEETSLQSSASQPAHGTCKSLVDREIPAAVL